MIWIRKNTQASGPFLTLRLLLAHLTLLRLLLAHLTVTLSYWPISNSSYTAGPSHTQATGPSHT